LPRARILVAAPCEKTDPAGARVRITNYYAILMSYCIFWNTLRRGYYTLRTHRDILLADSADWPTVGPHMEFRLTYAGPLYATQRDARNGEPPKHTENRRHIRRQFHVQLKRFWENVIVPRITPDLTGTGRSSFRVTSGGPGPAITIDELSKRHALYGFNFVPLVTAELDLLCGLDILFLRVGRPGSVVWPGDIDNRLKTLLDAMRIPEAGEKYTEMSPQSDEQPFFCLLEDDKLITKVSVDTDDLLDPLPEKDVIESADARLVITVSLRPYELIPQNMHLS
jgi:hypothetical protein